MMAARELLSLWQELVQMPAPACRTGFVPGMWQRARAASKATSILPRSLEAVSGLSFHNVCRTERTASVSILSTGTERIGAQYSRSVMAHCARCLALRHSLALASISASATSPNVGLPAFAFAASRLASIGFLPLMSVRKLHRGAGGLRRAERRPPSQAPSISPCSQENRKIHSLPPVGATTSRSIVIGSRLRGCGRPRRQFAAWHVSAQRLGMTMSITFRRGLWRIARTREGKIRLS